MINGESAYLIITLYGKTAVSIIQNEESPKALNTKIRNKTWVYILYTSI